MQTTIQFLDALKKRHDLTSDYQLSKLLDCTRSVISSYRMGKSRLSDDQAMKVAELLGLSEEYVLSCVAAERATSEAARKAWARAAKKLSGVAATIILASAALLNLPSPSEAVAQVVANSVYYVKS